MPRPFPLPRPERPAMARICVAVALAFLATGATPAAAQRFEYRYFGYGYRPFTPPPAYEEIEEPLSAGEVARLLRERGLRPVGPIRRGRDTYTAEVETRTGERLRVVVDAYEGTLLQRRVIARALPEPDWDEEASTLNGPMPDIRPRTDGAPRAAPLPPARPNREASLPPATSSGPAVVPAPREAAPREAPGRETAAHSAEAPAISMPAPARAPMEEVDPTTGALIANGDNRPSAQN